MLAVDRSTVVYVQVMLGEPVTFVMENVTSGGGGLMVIAVLAAHPSEKVAVTFTLPGVVYVAVLPCEEIGAGDHV